MMLMGIPFQEVSQFIVNVHRLAFVFPTYVISFPAHMPEPEAMQVDISSGLPGTNQTQTDSGLHVN